MAKRTVEVFSAGCSCCDNAVRIVREVACDSCDVQVHDMRDFAVQVRAKQYGINSAGSSSEWKARRLLPARSS